MSGTEEWERYSPWVPGFQSRVLLTDMVAVVTSIEMCQQQSCSFYSACSVPNGNVINGRCLKVSILDIVCMCVCVHVCAGVPRVYLAEHPI